VIMTEYHKNIFDTDKREFVGAFENMYQQETKENFDSWYQDDSRQLYRNFAAILEQCNFRSIVDIGSGKGALIHLLKKRNNKVVGINISPTAIEQTKARFPDIDFEILDVNGVDLL
jgi:trans-aconitate methyltransferase